MNYLKFNLFTLIAVVLNVLLFSTCRKESEPVLTVDPTILTFSADDSVRKVVTVETDAKSWNYFIDAKGSWIVPEKDNVNNRLYLSVQSYTDTENPRNATVTVSAGKASPVDITVIQEKKQYSLSASPTSLSYSSSESGEKSISITTDAATWEATSDAEWITLEKKQAEKTLIVSAKANSQITSRSGEITITAGNAPSFKISVSQGPAPITLTVSQTSLSFTASETGSKTVTVTTNATAWDATTSASWLSIEKNNNIITVKAAQNTSTSTRNAEIRVTATGIETVRTISVSQTPETLSINPTSIVFDHNETSTRNVTVTTTASSWNHSTPPSWLTLTKTNNNTLSVKPSQNTAAAVRSADITITAGNAPSVTLKVTQNGNVTFSVIPTSLSFTATETIVKTVNVTTNASSWSATKPSSATWLTISQNNSILRVNPNSQNTSTTARSTTITVSAPGANDITIPVTQAGAVPQPIAYIYNYQATSITLHNNSGYGSSWTGKVTPVNASTPYISFSSWGGSSRTVYCDYRNGKYWLDITTPVLIDSDGDVGYLCWGTVNLSNGTISVYPGVNYEVYYNPTTRVLDFSGTYNGLPVYITIIPKSSTTGQWLTDYYYFNEYRNLKIELTTTSLAPELSSDENSKSTISNFDENNNDAVKIERKTVTNQ